MAARMNQSESSINRTPKSEINQPGKIFEQSRTRDDSNKHKQDDSDV